MSGPWLWYVSRADGVVTLVLLTLIVVLGMLTAAHPRPHHLVATMAMGLHRTLALGVTVFLAAHITTALLDTYVHIGWPATVIPFASGYHRPWVGLGTVAFDIFLALIVTSVLRHRLPTRAWRSVHWFSYAMAPVAVAHAVMMSTTNEPLLLAVTTACGAAMAGATLWRVLSHDADRDRRVAIASQEWS